MAYYKQIYRNKFNNRDAIDKFFKLPKFSQKEENKNSLMSITYVVFSISINLPQRKIQA